MQRYLSTHPLSFTSRNLISILCCFLIIVAMWLGVGLDNRVALAAPEGITVEVDSTIANQPVAMNELKNKVRNDLKDTADSKASRPPENFTQGKVKQGQDKPKSDRVTEAAERLGASVDGRSRKNVEQVQGKVTRSRAINNPEGKVENAIEDVMSNIKDAVN
jgi:hypothetical protein